MYGNDDSDMKITGNLAPEVDESEAAARLYHHEKENGNLAKAQEAGSVLASVLLRTEGFSCFLNWEEDFAARNRCILFAFVADQAIDTFLPNHLTRQFAESRFYGELRDNAPGLYESISRSAAYSMYLICKRSGDGRRIGIGKIYAKVLRHPEDAALEREGELLYESFYNICIEHLRRVEFAV